MCENVTGIERVSTQEMTEQLFRSRYASSGVPIVVSNSTDHWPARNDFDLDFFRILYRVTKYDDNISKPWGI